MVQQLAGDRLTWLPEVGIGYFEVAQDGAPDYFEHYAALEHTDIAKRLTAARVDMLRRHNPGGIVVDVGVGAGTFVDAVPGCFGYDIQPAAVRWLHQRDRFLNPYREKVAIACFWDSLEHIPDPAPILANVTRHALIALPIFDDVQHVMRSKHYKPAEHCWYFTQGGLLTFMAAHGWRVLEINDYETQIGRDGIKSYAFERVMP